MTTERILQRPAPIFSKAPIAPLLTAAVASPRLEAAGIFYTAVSGWPAGFRMNARYSAQAMAPTRMKPKRM